MQEHIGVPLEIQYEWKSHGKDVKLTSNASLRYQGTSVWKDRSISFIFAKSRSPQGALADPVHTYRDINWSFESHYKPFYECLKAAYEKAKSEFQNSHTKFQQFSDCLEKEKDAPNSESRLEVIQNLVETFEARLVVLTDYLKNLHMMAQCHCSNFFHSSLFMQYSEQPVENWQELWKRSVFANIRTIHFQTALSCQTIFEDMFELAPPPRDEFWSEILNVFKADALSVIAEASPIALKYSSILDGDENVPRNWRELSLIDVLQSEETGAYIPESLDEVFATVVTGVGEDFNPWLNSLSMNAGDEALDGEFSEYPGVCDGGEIRNDRLHDDRVCAHSEVLDRREACHDKSGDDFEGHDGAGLDPKDV